MAAVSCKDCKAWIHDKDWKRSKRGGVDQPRPPGVPTPCKICPKGSPADEHWFHLTPRNAAAVRRYHEVQASNGACLSDAERADPWLQWLLSIIHREFKAFEEGRQLRTLIDIIALSRK